MNPFSSDKNNFFFDNKSNPNNIIKEKIIFEPKTLRNSISTNETYENEYYSDDEVDFNQDFFPQTKEIKLTDMLVDNWQEKIKAFCEDIKKELIIKAINCNYNFSNKK